MGQSLVTVPMGRSGDGPPFFVAPHAACVYYHANTA